VGPVTLGLDFGVPRIEAREDDAVGVTERFMATLSSCQLSFQVSGLSPRGASVPRMTV
jgi:hypothetical protein